MINPTYIKGPLHWMSWKVWTMGFLILFHFLRMQGKQTIYVLRKFRKPFNMAKIANPNTIGSGLINHSMP